MSQPAELFDKVVLNALDFLRRAAIELETLPKYSGVHFYAGLELFFKARLMREHWSLIVLNPEEASLQKLQLGEFKSVTLDNAVKRLRNVCGESFSNQEIDSYTRIRSRRNRVVHFFDVATQPTPLELEELVIEQCRAWYFLDNRLRHEWLKHFQAHKTELKKLGKTIHRNRNFLAAKFKEVGPHIKKAEAEGATFLECVTCGYPAAQLLEEEAPILFKTPCLVCESKWRAIRVPCPHCASPVSIMDVDATPCPKCKTAITIDYLITKYGPDQAFCMSCEFPASRTVIKLNDRFLCLNCAATFKEIISCEGCTEIIAGLDEYDTALHGCLFCDGRPGWRDE